jgi:hypothetical protein
VFVGCLGGKSVFDLPFYALINEVHEEVVVSLHNFFETFSSWLPNLPPRIGLQDGVVIVVEEVFTPR